MSTETHTASSTPSPAGPAPDPAAEPRARRHRHDVDLLRFVCAAAVVLGHVGGDYLRSVGTDPSGGAPVYWTGLVADSLSRFAVPMYFAIAGWAVLAGAPPRDARALGRRVLRLLPPLFVWTAVYIAWGRLRGTNQGPALDLAWQSLFGSVRPAYHLWYLYTYIPVILFLGFVVLLKAGRRPWAITALLAGIAVAGGHIADVSDRVGWDGPDFRWGFGVYQVVYAAAGAMMLSLRGRGLPRWAWWGVAGLGAGGVMWHQHEIHYVIPNANILIVVFTVGVAMAVSRVRVPERLRPFLARVGAASFGAYLVHVLVLRTLAGLVARPDHGWFAAVAVALGLTAATVTLSFAASMLWGRLRLRRVLG